MNRHPKRYLEIGSPVKFELPCGVEDFRVAEILTKTGLVETDKSVLTIQVDHDTPGIEVYVSELHTC